MRKLKVLDLFSGIGGFSLGLERAGLETIAFCEIDETAREVLKKHWPKIPIHEDILKLKGDKVTNVDVICGGFPCQDISIAGKGKGLNGKRSGLWKEYARLIEEIKPRYAIIENVSNLRSKGLARVMQDLWKIGYDCEWHIISASSVGALHKRERIWIIAHPHSELLRKQPGRRSRKERKDQAQSGINGEEWAIRNPCGQRLNGYIGEERYLQIDEKLHNQEVHAKRPECEFIPGPDGQILSERAIEDIRNTYSKHWELVPRVHRVINGLSKGMDRARKQRIKQLGNSIVPQIAELIGKEIYKRETMERENGRDRKSCM